MSKIQISELNSASNFSTLNTEETANVVGGTSKFYFPIVSYSIVAKYSSKVAMAKQANVNSNAQIALDGGYYFANNGNSNYSYQVNEVSLYQS